MSHFSLGVLVDAKHDQEAIKAKVAELLAPYDENTEVPEYDTQCGCVDWRATVDSRDASEKVHPIDELREQLTKELPELSPTDDAYEERKAKREARWKELLEPRDKVEKEVHEKHPLKDTPDPKCEECKGSGTVKSTYNPKSKWDWYCLGGRWDGMLYGEEYAKGRQTHNGFNFSDKNHTLSPNIRPANDVIKEGFRSFALVTPDGEWHERGRMGWWASVSDENNSWEDDFDSLLKQHAQGHNFVLCDCHI